MNRAFVVEFLILILDKCSGISNSASDLSTSCNCNQNWNNKRRQYER